MMPALVESSTDAMKPIILEQTGFYWCTAPWQSSIVGAV